MSQPNHSLKDLQNQVQVVYSQLIAVAIGSPQYYALLKQYQDNKLTYTAARNNV